MPGTNFLPTRGPELRDWFVNFGTLLDSNGPAAYGISDADASAFVAAADAFIAAFATAIAPATRTPLAIEAKDTAKKQAVEVARGVVARAQAWDGMTDEKRRDLRITVRDDNPTPIGRPTTVPELSVVSVQGRLLNLRLQEPGSTRRGKPAGVRGAWLYSYVGEEAPTDFKAMTFEGATTRTDPQIVVDEGVAPGSKVWVSACWVNPTDQPGSACLPVATWTNGGSSQVKQAA